MININLDKSSDEIMSEVRMGILDAWGRHIEECSNGVAFYSEWDDADRLAAMRAVRHFVHLLLDDEEKTDDA